MFKILGEIKWKDIEIGQVFAVEDKCDGAFCIELKVGKIKSKILANDDRFFDDYIFEPINGDCSLDITTRYKLPKRVQNLFITK